MLSRTNHQSRRGLSLIEVVASTMIVGMMAVATLNGLGAATKSAESIGNRGIALALADELMSEIVQQPYSDPDGSNTFGHETGEATSPRSSFDDVDDYNGWNVTPPQYRDGTVIPNRTGWTQQVQVTWVSPTNPIQTSSTETGVKRIRVMILYQSQILADESALRTNTDTN